MHRTTVIGGEVGSSAALRMVQELSGDQSVWMEREVLYPYYWLKASFAVPTIAGRQEATLDCLVDAINGLGATADHFATDDVAVSATAPLSARIDTSEAHAIARRTITHRLGKKFRMIASFDVSVAWRGLVHKRFWIVRSGEARVMIDSTTGRMHPLKSRAA